MESLTIKNENEEEFKEIAQTLFDKYLIQTYNSRYRLIEIEFYWHSPAHPDNCVIDRRHVNPKTGDWFFHYSGVDIALASEEKKGYGGILIRSIYNIDNGLITKGPLVCAMKLFSGTNAFSSFINTQIIPYEFEKKSDMQQTTRFGIGKIGKESGTDKLNYAFIIDPRK